MIEITRCRRSLGSAPPGVGHHARGARHSVCPVGEVLATGEVRDHLSPNAGALSLEGYRIAIIDIGQIRISRRRSPRGQHLLHGPVRRSPQVAIAKVARPSAAETVGAGGAALEQQWW